MLRLAGAERRGQDHHRGDHGGGHAGDVGRGSGTTVAPAGQQIPRRGRHSVPEYSAAGLHHRRRNPGDVPGSLYDRQSRPGPDHRGVLAGRPARPGQSQAVRRPATASACSASHWSTGRASCSSTSLPPGSIHRHGAISGTWSEDSRRHGTTIILTTHYMEEAQFLCDEIAIMDAGKIITQGIPTMHLLQRALTRTSSSNCRSRFHRRSETHRAPDVLETQGVIEIETNDVNQRIRLRELARPTCSDLNRHEDPATQPRGPVSRPDRSLAASLRRFTGVIKTHVVTHLRHLPRAQSGIRARSRFDELEPVSCRSR